MLIWLIIIVQLVLVAQFAEKNKRFEEKQYTSNDIRSLEVVTLEKDGRFVEQIVGTIPRQKGTYIAL